MVCKKSKMLLIVHYTQHKSYPRLVIFNRKVKMYGSDKLLSGKVAIKGNQMK